MRVLWTLAIEALSWMELENLSINAALRKSVHQFKVQNKKRITLARHLIRETLVRKNFVDKIINHVLVPSSLNDFNLGIQAFLRLYTYKTKFTVQGQDEAIQLTKIARTILGWKTVMPVEEALGKILSLDSNSLLENINEEERISLQTYNPTWFTKYTIRLLGRREACKLLKTTMNEHQTYICINPLKTSEKEVLSKLSGYGIISKSIDEYPYIFKIVQNKHSLPSLEEYKKGLLFTPNMIVCSLIMAERPKEDSTLFCIGPPEGFLAVYAALLMQNTGRVLSIHYPSKRINILRRSVNRLGINNVEVVFTKPSCCLPLREKANVVYLNPPSSQSGRFWRTAYKWRGANIIKRLIDLQWKMLDHCAEYIKKNGVLVYTTSSILVEENEMLIERFLKWHPEFIFTKIDAKIGAAGLRGQKEALRFFPHIHNVDGAYIAKLVKIKE
ncbi:MAG: hypothetical protein ACXACA_03830 [Candidatus Ranarchaeia archaeon]